MQSNDDFDLAHLWINTTQEPLFICGKAGTGKTTFLRQLPGKTFKKTMVVAPTGIAASNAGGVTVHGQFNLPMGVLNLFLKGALDEIVFTKNKKKAIAELQLLVIDEISMLRADTLDAIDYVLKKVRQDSQPFGGVQLLMIGDPFQLPPVTKANEWSQVRHIYKSPYFFHAVCFQQIKPVLIELRTVYRQKEQQFVDLLNSMRSNEIGEDVLMELNRRCIPSALADGYLTLTTHNEKAQKINSEALNQIDCPAYHFQAIIEGKFDLTQCVAENILELKIGMPAMLIKNHKEKPEKYYNGRIGIIADICENQVSLQFADGDILPLALETWLEQEYIFDERSGNFQKIVTGSLQQYPVKLAAAITIHKSQGLTFEKAIIDVEQVFVPGQIYVALSRLTSLEGLLLKVPVAKNTLKFDDALLHFRDNFLTLAEGASILKKAQQAYTHSLIIHLLIWKEVLENIYPAQFTNEPVLTGCYQTVKLCGEQAEAFASQIDRAFSSGSSDSIYGRALKAAGYFIGKIDNELLPPLKEFTRNNKNSVHTRRYLSPANSMATLLRSKRQLLATLERLTAALITGEAGGKVFSEALLHTYHVENQ